MAWSRRELLHRCDPKYSWSISHAQCPTPLHLDGDAVRIYYGSRDAANRTRPGFVDVDASNPHRVIRIGARPVMDLGPLGAFDDAGVMPACVVAIGDRIILYYAGWNTSTTVPYRISIGMAASDDGGETFERMFEGPILDRTHREPHFCSTPFVLRENGQWRMWYLSCLNWEMIEDRPEPHYAIRSAVSADGIAWSRSGEMALPPANRDECLARPWVAKSGNRWEMWYCRRSRRGYRTDKNRSYRIERAESADGLTWTRSGSLGGLETAVEGWDSEMTAYPAIYEHRGVRHLLYNGNGFGQSGIGHAIWQVK